MNRKNRLNKWCDREWIKFGCVVTGIVYLTVLWSAQISGKDWAMGVTVAIVMLGGGILLPENLLKKRDNAYGFRNNGYFDQFLNGEEH